jgi:hypothetical protein
MTAPARPAPQGAPDDRMLSTMRDVLFDYVERCTSAGALSASITMTVDNIRDLANALSQLATLRAQAVAGAEDTARLDWLDATLHPLPWGGVYALIEADGDSAMRVTVQPSSGDSAFVNETGRTLRAAIDAALTPERAP